MALLSGVQFPTTATKTTNSDTLAALLFSSASLAARRLRQADWGADDHDQADQGQADPPGYTPCQIPKGAAPRPDGTSRLACGRRLETISRQSPPASGEPDRRLDEEHPQGLDQSNPHRRKRDDSSRSRPARSGKAAWDERGPDRHNYRPEPRREAGNLDR